MDQFLLFGDSLTQQSLSQERGFAFHAALANAYIRSLDVVNRGFSGYNTAQALKVLNEAIPPPAIASLRFLTVWLGANDARLPNTDGPPQQHVPVDAYATNLRSILTHPSVKAHEDVRIIVITPPPVEESMQEEHDLQQFPKLKRLRRTAVANATYARAAREVAGELKLVCLDLWTIMATQAGYKPGMDWKDLPGSKHLGRNPVLEALQRDGLHFNPAGYELLYHELMSLISKTWPDQMPDRLKFVQPRWDDPEAWKGVLSFDEAT